MRLNFLKMQSNMKREVSVLLATINSEEPLIPIGVMDSADENTLREIIKPYIISHCAWGDEQGEEIDEWVDNGQSEEQKDNYFAIVRELILWN